MANSYGGSAHGDAMSPLIQQQLSKVMSGGGLSSAPPALGSGSTRHAPEVVGRLPELAAARAASQTTVVPSEVRPSLRADDGLSEVTAGLTAELPAPALELGDGQVLLQTAACSILVKPKMIKFEPHFLYLVLDQDRPEKFVLRAGTRMAIITLNVERQTITTPVLYSGINFLYNNETFLIFHCCQPA